MRINMSNVFFKLMSVLGFVCLFNECFAQVVNQPMSPEVSSIAKYIEIPVGTYTGIPNINIPIYEVKIRDLSIPISMSYHASGIKVEEEASSVGLGWNLNAEGSITRQIRGTDDFIGGGWNSTGSQMMDMQSIMYQSPYYSRYVWNALSDNIFPWNGTQRDYTNDKMSYDFQPDMYFFNIGGTSGKFFTFCCSVMCRFILLS